MKRIFTALIAAAVGLSLVLITPTVASANDGEMSIERAGNYYLKIICNNNSAISKYEQVVFGKKNVVRYKEYKGKRLKKSRKAARTMSKAEYRAASKLQHPPAEWPSGIAGRIDQMIDNLLDASDQLDKVATRSRRKSFDTLDDVTRRILKGAKHSKRVRAYFDLPPNGEGC